MIYPAKDSRSLARYNPSQSDNSQFWKIIYHWYIYLSKFIGLNLVFSHPKYTNCHSLIIIDNFWNKSFSRQTVSFEKALRTNTAIFRNSLDLALFLAAQRLLKCYSLMTKKKIPLVCFFWTSAVMLQLILKKSFNSTAPLTRLRWL